MKTIIITSSYKRPELLQRLGDIIIPLINKTDRTLKWRVVIDGPAEEYKFILNKFSEKVIDKSSFTWSEQKNIGKFKSLVKIMDEEKTQCDWLVNIDDDDVLINYRFESFLNIIETIPLSVKAILVPRLMLKSPTHYLAQIYKKKLFKKYDQKIISYFGFKDKFGDVDTSIFIRSTGYKFKHNNEVLNDSFTSESLLYLDSFPNEDILILNNHLVYSQYLAQGLTGLSKHNRISNPISAVATYKKFLEQGIEIKSKISLLYVKSLINYYRFNLHANKKNIINNKKYGNFIIRFIASSIGEIIFFYDKLLVKKK
ncbi:hypothetical protein [Candidatus Pelagibacter sp. Uisw_090]|uniref:hypothetical protein n=1 Tax=Candidatus Pelagibacter sp. Uisw_090 TaxID=3230993 RepID=UPI0039E868B7